MITIIINLLLYISYTYYQHYFYTDPITFMGIFGLSIATRALK